MTTTATPRTSAGRDALEILADPNSQVEHRHLILAIEREAAPAHDALLAALRALVEALRTLNDALDWTARGIHKQHAKLGTYDACSVTWCRRNAKAFWDAEHALAALAAPAGLDVDRTHCPTCGAAL